MISVRKRTSCIADLLRRPVRAPTDPERQKTCVSPSLEQDGVVEQQSGEMSRWRRSALTAEHAQLHGETIARTGIKAP